MAETSVIGIDLGTTYSVVSVWDWAANRAEIITNEQGNRTTPSVVSYFREEILVGEAAKNKIPVNPEGTIYNAKRIIGRTFNDVAERQDLSVWPFVVVADQEGRARFQVRTQSGDRVVPPEEISALVLQKLKQIAEKHLNSVVTKAVVTVPAYFTEPQRRATQDAARIAGLEVLGLLTEPTAAALAYGLDQRAQDPEKQQKIAVDGWHILVFDLGGGTLDISILKLDGKGSFVTKAVAGDFHLGGEDFDDMLVQYVIHLLARDFPSLQLSKRTLGRLRTECEALKRMLTASEEAILDTELQGIDVVYAVTRKQFEHLCQELFETLRQEVFAALDLARLSQADIDDVILVGGSSRIPRVQEILKECFPGRGLWSGINPDEAVAVGAAIQAAALTLNRPQQAKPSQGSPAPKTRLPPPPHVKSSQQPSQQQQRGPQQPPPPSQQALQNSPPPTERPPPPSLPTNQDFLFPNHLVLTGVTPFTLGIELSDGTLDTLIRRGTPLPASKTDLYTTSIDNQQSVIIKVFEGEKKRAKANTLLGKFSLQVRPAKAGTVKIEVTFEVTADGLFNVIAKDLQSMKKTFIQIERPSMNKEEMNQLMSTQKTLMGEVGKQQNAAAEKEQLTNQAIAIQTSIAKLGSSVSSTLREQAMTLVTDMFMWLEANPSATATDYAEQRGALQQRWNVLSESFTKGTLP